MCLLAEEGTEGHGPLSYLAVAELPLMVVIGSHGKNDLASDALL